MFNLLMSGSGWQASRDTFDRSRVLEHTDDDVKARFNPNGVLDLAAVTDLPTLFASETNSSGEQLARVGNLTRVRLVGNEYHLDYTFDPDIRPIPNTNLEQMAGELGIVQWEFSRTHWAIKNVDLYKVLFKQGLGQIPKPKVFDLNVDSVDDDLVSVMMPFDARFDPAYAALQAAVTEFGMKCQRADDIWVHDHVIQDVVSLICRANVVICDLSGRNANVFYETGIAHTLGRDVIMIAQNAQDVPFDVGHIRHIRYLNNGEGLRRLAIEVQKRLGTLRARR